ncbi:MAG TPA: dihydrofolate reductase family protein [Phototrophicaceae bacterium]|nr:dihydrofolate reductase family protein [Phototrophicaceae bacterium]
MRDLFLLMNVSLDGYFEGPDHDLSWATHDFAAFRSETKKEVDTLLFGHRTYEMMESFWPTPQATEMAPDVAQFMNQAQKVVVSHQPFTPKWDKVTVISADVVSAVRRLKAEDGQSIAIFGSNELCVSLMPTGLIDEFQIQVNPVALGDGTPLFKGLPEKAELALIKTHTFPGGVVLLTYRPC